MELPAGFLARLAVRVEEAAAVEVIAEDGFAAVIPVHQMIDGSGKLDAQRAGHVRELTRPEQYCSLLELPLYARAAPRGTGPGASGLGSTEGMPDKLGDEAKSRSLSNEHPLTGKPDAGDPPVRFGGRGGGTAALPTPIAGVRPSPAAAMSVRTGIIGIWEPSRCRSSLRPRQVSVKRPKEGMQSALLPVKWAAMQVHHGFEVKRLFTHTVNDGVRKTLEVEFAIVAPDFSPAVWLGHDPAQRGCELIKEVISQAGLFLLIPKGRSLQLQLRFRMADDAH